MGSSHSKKKSQPSPESPSSLSSSNTQSANFQFIGERRFHKDNSEYFFPNDDEECDRLHLQHFLLKEIWDRNFSAPIENNLKKNGTRVLDSGYVFADHL